MVNPKTQSNEQYLNRQHVFPLGVFLFPNAIKEFVATQEQLISTNRRGAVEFRIVAFNFIVADKLIFWSCLDDERSRTSADSKHVISSGYHRSKELNSPAASDSSDSIAIDPLARVCLCLLYTSPSPRDRG